MNKEEENVLEDWSEIMELENSRRRKDSKVEMSSMNDNKEKISFQEKLTYNLNMDGKK